MKKQFATVLCLIVIALASGCGEPPVDILPKVYITDSYYDLRNEAKSLYEKSGLTYEDTAAKRESVMRQMNDDFRSRYVGKYVKWTGGYVSDVNEEYGRFICAVEMDKDALFSTVDVFIPVSKQVAMDLSKYKEVLIDGKIKSLSGSLKVEIEDATISYTGKSLDDMVDKGASNNP